MRALLVGWVALLLVVGCGGGVSQGGGGSTPPPSARANSVTVKLIDYSIQPAQLTVPQGISISVENDGQAPHNLYIRDNSSKVLAHTSDLDPGQKADLKIDVVPGTYIMYCEEPGHESLGMKGTIMITN
ncbi:MAG: cupredoxin domain-containing protein [Candidatus Dormibacteraceae bacterium]